MVSRCSTDWYADPFSDNGRGYSPCMHRKVVLDSTGGRRFIDGEVDDDVLVRCLCMDCGEYLSESGDNGTWRGESLEDSLGLQLGDDFEDAVVPIREEVNEW
jgi:hypothetical protein